jgi:PIN domain nuclease of toxin-antitoxin system
LDTHAFIWFCSSPERLSERARSTIVSGTNQILLSVVTAWEIAIKYRLGRVPELPAPPESFIPGRMEQHSLEPLLIVMEHAFRVAHLPPVHRDPFDRLLIAQAQIEGLPVVTSDPNFARYDVEVIW